MIAAALFFAARRWRWNGWPALAGLLSVTILAGALDAYSWGRWFSSIVTNVDLNLFRGLASQYGTEPVYYYLLVLVLLTGGLACLGALGLALSAHDLAPVGYRASPSRGDVRDRAQGAALHPAAGSALSDQAGGAGRGRRTTSAPADAEHFCARRRHGRRRDFPVRHDFRHRHGNCPVGCGGALCSWRGGARRCPACLSDAVTAQRRDRRHRRQRRAVVEGGRLLRSASVRATSTCRR